MTLERHKSHLIPEVQYSLDGTLFVTDVGGTFPVRGKFASHRDVREHDFGNLGANSFRSYDPRREEKKRRYKQRPSAETFTGASIGSTNTSSLGRRLRKSKRKFDPNDPKFTETEFKYKDYTGSMSVRSTEKRLNTGTPQMTREFAATLTRKSTGSKDLNEILRTGSTRSRGGNKHESLNGYGDSNGFVTKERYRKIHDEKLPSVIFVIAGVLLLCIGIIRIIVSHWHEYYCAIWTGALALCLGIIGIKHKGLYLLHGLNGAYILFAFLTGFASLVATGLVLHVLVPIVLKITDKQPAPLILTSVLFTNMNATVSTVSLSAPSVIWANLALDIITLIFLFLVYFAMTAAMIAIGNHWDACYDTTADCDHRGNPRLFNPIEQVGLGVATAFVGLVYVAGERGFTNISHLHFYSTVWSAVMVIIAGIISLCFGKRTDQLAMGTFACFMEMLAFVSCGVAAVMVTLGIVQDVTEMQKLPESAKAGTKYKELVGMIVLGAAVNIMVTINIIFIVGTVFRHFRQVCCRRCCGGSTEGVSGRYGSMERPSNFSKLHKNPYIM